MAEYEKLDDEFIAATIEDFEEGAGDGTPTNPYYCALLELKELRRQKLVVAHIESDKADPIQLRRVVVEAMAAMLSVTEEDLRFLAGELQYDFPEQIDRVQKSAEILREALDSQPPYSPEAEGEGASE